MYVCACVIIIMYICHALINALSAHMIHVHINLNMIFCTHVEHSVPLKIVPPDKVLRCINALINQ